MTTPECEQCNHAQHEKGKCAHSNPYGRCECGIAMRDCYMCNGIGELPNDPEWDDMTHECTNCGGTGKMPQ